MILGAFLYVIGGFIEVIVALRFVFELIGANPSSQIVNWIYSWSTPFVTPFADILGKNASITGIGTVTTGVFDWTALIALIVYGLILSVLSAFTRRYSY